MGIVSLKSGNSQPEGWNSQHSDPKPFAGPSDIFVIVEAYNIVYFVSHLGIMKQPLIEIIQKINLATTISTGFN